ncbi:YkyA family protein [Paenibacillus illinoisensis]|uniref:YkyA family protein n=1 Tax=Paenibacillus illinoisensis TaxID=59845 RepID=UPI003D28550E
MARIGKSLLILLCLSLLIIVNSCREPEEPAANQVNRLVVNDEQINESFREIALHEQEDMELYELILKRGKENGSLESLLDQAQVNREVRRKLLDQTQVTMNGSKKLVSQLQFSLNELSVEKEKTLALELLNLYEHRADTLEEFVSTYKQSLLADQRLYEMMRKDAEPDLVKIKQVLQMRNNEFAKLQELRRLFNQQTATFNSSNERLVEMKQRG